MLVDFGFATFWKEKKYLFTRCGTPGFVAPEIANSKVSEQKSINGMVDLFSFGCILHIL